MRDCTSPVSEAYNLHFINMYIQYLLVNFVIIEEVPIVHSYEAMITEENLCGSNVFGTNIV